MNFTNNYHIKIFDDFYSAYGQQIDKLWLELKDVVIDVYDKDSARLKDYIINRDVFGDMSGEINSPFQCYPKFQYYNQTFNDIIMRGDLCNTAHLTQQEQFALIAHEIGHFVSKYKNTGLNGQADEFYADDRTVELGLRCELASALQKCMAVIPQPNISDPFLQMIQKQQNSVKNMADMLRERIDRL